jgi:hypothetical protein
MSIGAFFALILGFTFSASYAQSNSNNSKMQSSKQYTLKGKVVSSQTGQAVANAKVMLLKNNNKYQMNNMKNNDMNNQKNDTTKTQYNNNTGMTGMNSQMKATTDQDGSFKISNIPAGTYWLKVKSNNHKTWKKKVTIKKNGYRTIKLKSK